MNFSFFTLLFATSFFLSISEKCSYIRDCSCIYMRLTGPVNVIFDRFCIIVVTYFSDSVVPVLLDIISGNGKAWNLATHSHNPSITLLKVHMQFHNIQKHRP